MSQSSCGMIALAVLSGMLLLFPANVSGFVVPLPQTQQRQRQGLQPPKISLDDSWSEVAIKVERTLEKASTIGLDDIIKQVKAIEWTKLLAPGPGADQIGMLFESIRTAYGALPPEQQVGFVLLPFIAAAAGISYVLSFPPDSFRDGYEPYGRGNYDPIQARVYYSKHPFLVLQRSLQIFRLSNRFIFNILWDKYILRNEEANREQRAQEALELVNQLGPTAIKVGQALSVRPDLVPPEYARSLSTLQDRVPPFDGTAARKILQTQLGSAKAARLKNLSFEKGPVASASIGQVYRGTLAGPDQQQVAVKVQRPNVLAEIALDLFIVREFAPYYQKLTRSATDFQGLVNEWGRGFIAELDYQLEAANTKKFNREMQKRNLNAVIAPEVFEEYSSDRILVTEWIEGTRLDKSKADDVPRLCSVALNAYLVMLLELQSLHCDPHPGNLLRTEDGRLCILDFGMTLETDKTLQYSLLEFVAHLTGEDYDRIPEDLVKLGFLKAERLETVRSSGFLEPLTYMLKQAGKGGGAKKVRERIFAEFREKYPGLDDEQLRVQMRQDVQEQIEEARRRESAVSGITMEVEELQKKNKDAFTIPPWFVYTSRAFLTLEGVSLQADEDYSIVKSCFPYVAKRLVGDDSPRARKALKDMLYGAGDYLDAKRLGDLADGFATYTTTSKVVDEAVTQPIVIEQQQTNINNGSTKKKTSSVSEAEAAITLAKDSADILLSPDGNLVQNLLVEESALAASAQVKDALLETLVNAPQRFRESIPLGLGNALPKLPLEDQVKPFLKKTPGEEKAQNLIVSLSSSALPSNNGRDSSATAQSPPINTTEALERLSEIDPEQAALVAKELRENLPKYAPLVGQLGEKFASTLLKTASANIESTLVELEDKDGGDELVKSTAKNLASLATRGATAMSRRISAQQEQERNAQSSS